MSKLSEYSKFDHIASDSEDDESSDVLHAPQSSPAAATARSGTTLENTTPQSPPTMKRDDVTKHILFQIGGQTIYQWEQTLDEVVLYIPPPDFPSFSASLLECQIMAKHLRLGLRGNKEFFIDEPTFGAVDTKASTWCLEPVETTTTMNGKPGIHEVTMIAIHLVKANKGVVWDAVLCGKFPNVALNPFDKNQIQQELMLERFQEENPGFDFRGADFNGSVPDPRTFMGGVKYP